MNIRSTIPDDGPALRELRLLALSDAPTAFGADVSEDAVRPDAEWVGRATPTPDSVIFVAETTDGAWAGMAGVFVNSHRKMAHVGNIWGVFVAPEFRGNGVGRRLIDAGVEWAKKRGLSRVRLTVVTDNVSAIHLYVRAGFSVYGVETDALRVGERSYDELLMHRALND